MGLISLFIALQLRLDMEEGQTSWRNRYLYNVNLLINTSKKVFMMLEIWYKHSITKFKIFTKLWNSCILIWSNFHYLGNILVEIILELLTKHKKLFKKEFHILPTMSSSFLIYLFIDKILHFGLMCLIFQNAFKIIFVQFQSMLVEISKKCLT